MGSKYAHPWIGPYKILSKVSDRNYILKIGESRVTVNVDRIKPYRGVYVEEDKNNLSKTDKFDDSVERCVGDNIDNDNDDDDSDETWLFAEPLIERVELPELNYDELNVDENFDFNESSEIEPEDHRDIEYEPQVNVSPVRDDGPAFRTRAKVRL